ncbi:hypothetical protein G4V62_05295 [Bacillaceae bacterium SIJ1]|uniref:hypothetical protein n=1 Tax=Litoribacterium kuwaitense TaxID=1398745 RepID=UPI0013EBFD0B|nr:hypothetical protein [Litoribacterium kuwaitense]NGP44397.1 hypothetical protein [Litoribacterium kuwaitense]
MKPTPMILLIVFSIALVSCQQDQAFIQQLAEEDDLHVFIVSNNENPQKEEELYDVLLQLKNKYPDELSQFKLITGKEAETLPGKNDIHEFPCVVITSKGQTLGVFGGESMPKEELASRLEHIVKAFKS